MPKKGLRQVDGVHKNGGAAVDALRLSACLGKPFRVEFTEAPAPAETDPLAAASAERAQRPQPTRGACNGRRREKCVTY